jgi:hypothetical protein
MSDIMDILKSNVHSELDKINNTNLMKAMSIELVSIKPENLEKNEENKTKSENNENNQYTVQSSNHIHTNFKLPIHYLDTNELFPLSNVVCDDLELCETTKNSSMYNYLFLPKHQFAKEIIEKWKTEYTTNIDYLNDTKIVIQNIDNYKTRISDYYINYDKLITIWKDIKEDDMFFDKYGYMDWNMLQYLNESSSFLQCLSFVNFASPVISLIIPIFFIICPFILLKIQGIEITFEIYFDVLTDLAKNHFIGKALSSMKTISWDKVVYLIVTFGLYILQIYQNINTCKRFYNNIQKINNTLIELREYVEYSISSMETFININSGCISYQDFLQDVENNCNYLKDLYNELLDIKPFSHSLSKFGEFGSLLKCYYQLYANPGYESGLRYSMGFEGYINNLIGINENIKAGNIHFGELSLELTSEFKEQFYPPLINEMPIKNNCSFNKNMIISGPNKAGKTTILKTTVLNIIFTQQFGCGFYKSAVLNPYTHIHSYLNIPDTSGRDSLFQAEARRCKDILDVIHKYKDTKYRHFCIFDELYSGTNPDEASKAGHAFLEYLSRHKNVNFILTTHYLSICKKYKKSDYIKNFKMQVNILDNGDFDYTYKIQSGISKIKGALRVLKDMDYPTEIIGTIENAK